MHLPGVGDFARTSKIKRNACRRRETPTPSSAAVRLLQETVQRIRPDRGRIKGAPFWSEASFLTARGIPTVYFAPGDISICHTAEEHVVIVEYLSSIAALAEFIDGYCGART